MSTKCFKQHQKSTVDTDNNQTSFQQLNTFFRRKKKKFALKWKAKAGFAYSVFKSDRSQAKKKKKFNIVQELCESRGGRPGLSVLTSLLVSVERITEPCFGTGHNLSLICQLTSEDTKQHFIIIKLKNNNNNKLQITWYTCFISHLLRPLQSTTNAAQCTL